MKKLHLFKTVLLLCALIVGSVNFAWGQDVVTAAGLTDGVLTSGNYTLTCAKNSGSTAPTYNSDGKDLRIYAKGSVKITTTGGNMTSIVFDLSAQGKKRLAPISASNGKVSQQNSGDAQVIWTGNTNDVTFTVGDKANFGSDGSTKAGQLCFLSVTITTASAKKNTTLTLSPSSLALTYGGSTGTLTATVTPDGESALDSPTITWTSDDESVATVVDGVVTPKGEGTANITATYAGDEDYNGSNQSAEVTVTDSRTAVATAISSIWFQKTLYVGRTAVFTPSVTLADGLKESDVSYSYESADPSTIRINDDGTYTVLKTGTGVEITVTVTPIAAQLATYKPVSAVFEHNASYRYSKPIFTPTGVTEGNFSGSMTLEMTNDGTPVGPIYYTTNGEDPNPDKSNCTLYSSTLTLSVTTTVKARVIDDDGLYSTVTSATYTKVPANKDAISLAAGQSLSFADFSGAGNSYWSSESKYLISSDGDKYKWTGTDVGNFTGTTLQIKNNTSSYFTSVNITAPYGFKMNVTNTGSVYVYVGETKQDAANDGAYYFPTNTAVTLKRGTSSTPQVSNITFTALKQPAATNVAITDPGTLAKGATGTFTYSKDSEVENTKTWTSSDASVIEIKNAATGAYEAKGRGTATITLTITPTDGSSYEAVSAKRNVSVTAPVVITANDVAMTYGDAAKAIGATTSTDYAGTLTYESGNTSIATVDASGNVTAVSAGTTTITISAPADAENLYTAGEDVVINVTVNAAAGAEETPEDIQNIYSNNLLSNTFPSGWTGDGEIWSGSSSYGAVAETDQTSGTFDLVSTDINLAGYKNVFMYFEHTGRNFETPSSACKVYVQEGSNEPELLSMTYFGGKNWTFVNTGNIDLSAYDGKTVHFIFRYTPTVDNNGKWEVKNFKVKGTRSYDEAITVASSGFSTHCYQYPLDLDLLDEDVKAYIVTSVEGTNVTFQRITGTIKGGVPFILYGTAGEHTLYTAANSTNVPESNMLVGTLAPTYITATNGDYTNFGLKNGKFVKATNGVIGANKAYLPILTSSLANGAHEFNIIFDEGETTAISEVRGLKSDVRGEFYNLNGQRVATPVKGNIYIVNGKKVMFK